MNKVVGASLFSVGIVATVLTSMALASSYLESKTCSVTTRSPSNVAKVMACELMDINEGLEMDDAMEIVMDIVFPVDE